MRFLHSLSKSKGPCKRNLAWCGDTLRCSICHEPAGFRWLENDSVAIYLFPEFKDAWSRVTELEDTYHIRGASDVLGKISFRDFDEFIADIKERTSKISDPEEATDQAKRDIDANLIYMEDELAYH